jgi:hypothetical protein
MRSEHSGEHVWADGTGQTGHSGDRERMRYQMAAALWHKLSWWRAPTSEKLNQFARGVDPLAEVRAQTGLQIQEKALRFQARLEVRDSSFESLDNRHRFVRPRPPRDIMSALFLVTALNSLSLCSPSHELSLSLRISRTGEPTRLATGLRPTSGSEKIRASSGRPSSDPRLAPVASRPVIDHTFALGIRPRKTGLAFEPASSSAA